MLLFLLRVSIAMVNLFIPFVANVPKSMTFSRPRLLSRGSISRLLICCLHLIAVISISATIRSVGGIIPAAQDTTLSNSTQITLVSNSCANFNCDDRTRRSKRSPRIKLPNGILPEFKSPIGNVTTVVGRDVQLICQVENLGQYQVAWLKKETKTILSIDTNIIITNYRIFLIPDEEEKKWALHIKDVQESDRGSYQCQLNTNPMRSISGYLEVVVPPSIIENQTTQAAEVDDRSNVTIECRASGHPRPTISWRREDNLPIKLTGDHLASGQNNDNNNDNNDSSSGDDNESSIDNEQTTTMTTTIKSKLEEIRSERLVLHDIDMSMAGVYVCTASNGIPVPVSKRVPIYVKFKPKVLVQGNNQQQSVQVGDHLEVECLIEAFPKPNVYWTFQPLASIAKNKNNYNNNYDGQRGHLKYGMMEQAAANYHNSSPSLPINQVERQQQRYIRLDGSSLSPLGHLQHRRQNRMMSVESKHQFGNGDELNRAKQMRPYNDVAVHQVTSPDSMPSAIKSPMSVKHSIIDWRTFKLTMTISRLKQSDLGDYTCIASNAVGQSESRITIDPNGKSEGNQESLVQNSRIFMDQPTEASAFKQLNPDQFLQQNSGKRLAGHRIYDEKYLEAVKARQNNGATSSGIYANNFGKSNQKLLKYKPHDRNGAGLKLGNGQGLILVTSIIVTLIAVFLN